VRSSALSQTLPATQPEKAKVKLRGRAISATFLFFSLGAFLAAALATFAMPVVGWRGLFLIGAAPAVLILAVRWLVPETPRFLLHRGRVKQARAAASWIAGGAPAPALHAVARPAAREDGHGALA